MLEAVALYGSVLLYALNGCMQRTQSSVYGVFVDQKISVGSTDPSIADASVARQS